MSEANNRRNQLSDLISQKGAVLSNPPMLLPANLFFELAGEEFGRRLLLTSGVNDVEYCLRPEFTIAIANEFLQSQEKNQEQSAAIGYMGKIFRQRAKGPSEFDQLGIEYLGQTNVDLTLEKTFDFALSAIKIYSPISQIKLGSIAIFETILSQIDIPKVWQPRIRHRFGQKQGMSRLLKRLSDPQTNNVGALPWNKQELTKVITDQMLAASLPLIGSRTPEEIANRYFEKQQLASSKVPKQTISFLQTYLNIKGEASEALSAVEALANDNGLDIKEPLERVKTHIKQLQQKYQIEQIIFDASFSPRLDYYTGIVFEVTNNEKTLASGGEYHRLLQRLGANSQINASGCSVWIDRLEQIINLNEVRL